MTGITVISKEYIDKGKLVDTAKKIANELKFEVQTENLYTDLHDLNFYIDVDEEMAYLITFWSMNEDEFKRDEVMVNNEKYYISIGFDHDSEALPYLNKFLTQFLKIYPEMLVGDEAHDNFYSIKQIEEKENLPKWLLL